MIEVAVEAKTKADQDKLSVALARLAEEDPSFRVTADPESGQTVIKGMGELHLDILIDRMRREFKVGANVGQPQVAYRETIGRDVHRRPHPPEADRRGRPVRARQDRAGAGWSRARASPSRARSWAAPCPRSTSPAVEKGIELARQGGIVAGFPVIDFKARLVDGASHDVDSSSLAFEIAARVGVLRRPAGERRRALLEPVMKVEVVTPEDYLGDVIGDLNARRGQVGGMEPRGNAQVIRAMVPLATMFGYVNTLRSLTQGRAQFTMEFDHYDQVPSAVSDEVRARYA